MINLQTITNVTDCVPLYLPHSLYLKPLAKLSLSVGLPPNKMGKSISNFDIMDKLTKALAPDKFLILKVSKSTLEVIRLEAELEEPGRLQSALARLDGMSFKVNGFTESFKVRAKETKDEFPNRHDWDIFFRDAHYMDEMKAGERPDTIHLANLPIRWFCPRHMENDDNVKPSESIFKRIFEKFGAVRAVDVPLCDAFRQKMSSDVNGIKVHNFEQDLFFEGYVQFDEYIGFVRAMDEFRGMKLVRKFVDKTQAVNIIVNFDKTKHLSDASVLRRERMRSSLLAKVKAKEDEEDKKKKKEQEKIERERKLAEEIKLKELERQREREELRKKKHLKKLEEKGQLELSRKIRLEEKKLLIAQRKLESIRVLEALFERLKVKDIHEKGTDVSHNSIDLRQRLVDKYKSATEKLLSEQKRKLESEKLQTGLSGLLKHRKFENDHSDGNSANGNAKSNGRRKKKSERMSSDSSSSSLEDEEERKKKPDDGNRVDQVFNPFKDGYTSEAAAELMKMSTLSYGVFPGMPMYRPSFPPAHSMRGYIPRGRGGPPRVDQVFNPFKDVYTSEAAAELMKMSMLSYGVFPGMPMYRPSFPPAHSMRGGPPRGPRRGGYNYHGSTGYTAYNYYNDYRNGGGMSNDYHERYGGDYKQARSYSRSRSRKRSRTRSRSRSRSHSRSRSRTRSRHRRYSRSRRSRHRSNTRSHSRSRSRSRSRSHRSRTKDRSRSRSQSRIRENRSRSTSRAKSHSNRAKSESKSQSVRARTHSRSKSRSHRTRSKSKSKTQTKRSRSVSKQEPTSTRVRSTSRSQSKSKTKDADNTRSNSRDRTKTSTDLKSKTKSRTHHSEHKSKSHKARSRSPSSSKEKSSSSKRTAMKLVSTRRSRSQLSWSRSPSPPRRSWSKSVEP